MNETVTTDTMLKIIGLKEVEMSVLKQQLEALVKENSELKAKKESKP